MNVQSQAIMDKRRYRAIIISPHLDDAVFSCGGAMAQWVKEGPVLVLNLFTRYLSDLKIHGAVLGEARYQEESAAANFLGFESRNLDELDAPFRRDAYKKIGNLFRPPVSEDLAWLPILRENVFAVLAELDYDQLYVPLGIGWHVDHVLTYLVFEPWAERENLRYYEDAPYCTIPHSTRYRLDEISTHPHKPDDLSLVPINETRAWWQAAMAYSNTAMMKNLTPWIVRQCAIPVVSYYLQRLMAQHRKGEKSEPKRKLRPVVIPIADQITRKVDAMALYSSQFRGFYSSRQDCIQSMQAYAYRSQSESDFMERYWTHDASIGS